MEKFFFLLLLILFFQINSIFGYTYCGAPSEIINTKQEGYELVGFQSNNL